MFMVVDQGTEGTLRLAQKASISTRCLGEFVHAFFGISSSAGLRTRYDWHIRTTVPNHREDLLFTTLDIIHREGIWSPIWSRPAGDQRVTLQKFSKKRRWVMLDLHLSVSGGEKGKVDDPKEG